MSVANEKKYKQTKMREVSDELIRIITSVLDNNQKEVDQVLENFKQQRIFNVGRACNLTSENLTSLGLSTLGDQEDFRHQVRQTSETLTQPTEKTVSSGLSFDLSHITLPESSNQSTNFGLEALSEVSPPSYKYARVSDISNLFEGNAELCQRLKDPANYDLNNYVDDLHVVVRLAVDDLLVDWQANTLGLTNKNKTCPTKELKTNLAVSIVRTFPVLKLGDDETVNDFFYINVKGGQHQGHIQTRLRTLTMQEPDKKKKILEYRKEIRKRKKDAQETVPQVPQKKARCPLEPTLSAEQIEIGLIAATTEKFASTVSAFEKLLHLRPDIRTHEEVLTVFPNLLAFEGKLLWTLTQTISFEYDRDWEKTIRDMIQNTVELKNYQAKFGELESRFDSGVAAACYWASFTCKHGKQGTLNNYVFTEIKPGDNVDNAEMFSDEFPHILLKGHQRGVRCDKRRRIYQSLSTEAALGLVVLIYHFFSLKYPVEAEPFYETLEVMMKIRQKPRKGKQSQLLKILQDKE